MLERTEELKQRVRETPLNERLEGCRRRIGAMCSEGRPPRMCIPVQHDDDDFYISTTLADAQQAVERLEAKVKVWEMQATNAQAINAERCTEVERLERELNAIKPKYQALVAFYDQHNGTPCEQIRHQQEIAQLRESRQCAETYMLILADKLQFSSSQFPQLSSGWCEELVNTITALQSQLAVAQAQVLEAQDGVNALLEASSDRCRKHEQQVAQLRENVSKIECELSEWKLASAANETGHLFRCARVNGKWSCAKGCPAAAHTTLRGLVEQANYELAALFPVPDRPTFENAFTVCGNKNTADARCILNAYEAIHEAATLPREGVTSHGGEHE